METFPEDPFGTVKARIVGGSGGRSISEVVVHSVHFITITHI